MTFVPAVSSPCSRSTLELAPGRYELRIGAAAGDRVGSVFLDLEISDFARAPFSTSGVMVVPVPRPGDASARLEVASAARPSVRRTFGASDVVNVIWQLYQRGADRVVPVTVAMTITDDHGGIVSTTDTAFGVAQFDVEKTATWVSALPLKDLAAGEYLVTLKAMAGSRSESANVRIRIQ